METKRLIASISFMLVLLLGYRLLMSHLQKVHPTWFPDPNVPAEVAKTSNPTTNLAGPATNVVVASTNPSVASATMPVAPPVVGGPQVVAAPVAVPATLGNDPKYPMVISIDPKGAGIDSVVLSDFWETAEQKEHYSFQKPIDGFESITRPMATRSVTIDGQDADLSNAVWALASSSVNSATYTALVNLGGKPALELTKTFKLLPKDSGEGSGYDIRVNQSFRNLSGRPLKVSVIFNGPTPPARENDRSDDRRYVTGNDDGYKTVTTGGASVGEFAKGKPAKDLITSDTRPLLWIGACNSYFDSIYRPDYAGNSATPAIKLASASVVGIDTQNEDKNAVYPTQLAISTNEFTLPAGATDSLDAHAFFGPKQRSLLKDAYYSAFPREYETTLVYTGGICGYVTFTWLINALYGILWFFHKIFFHDWGIAIICLVALVRTLLHPITKKSQINMMEMSKKGPELERLKKKFADDKEALIKAQAELMNPAGMIFGCLPMFLQTPIWIALWSALQSTFELRQAGFLRWQHVHLTWIADLSQPDRLWPLPFHIPVPFIGPITDLNLLPLLLGVVFFVNQAMQPAPANMTPEQQQQRKMMKWMSLLFPVMLYKGPSGLTLYIMTSTTIGIIENKIIRDHIKQREEAEKAGRIIVDAAPTRNNKSRKKDNLGIGSKPAPAKTGGLAGWLADLQAKADQIKREADRRGNK